MLKRLTLAFLTASLACAQTDPVGELNRRIEKGDIQLAYDPVTGYLPAALKALDIPVESQMAVFSKTSVQGLRIDPVNPRVLFFNDSVIAGWVRGGFVEFASHDPRHGIVFYRLDQRPAASRQHVATLQPESPLNRREDCLHCHMAPVTLGVPGVLFRSVFPSPSGVPLNHAPQYDTDSRVPFEKLWGGWYVTGNSGAAKHMGNLTVTDMERPESMLEKAPVHLDSLEGSTGPGARLTPYSDVVALLVFEHQARMMNLLTRAVTAGSAAAYDELAEGLLFTGEAPLPEGISGTSGFTEVFAARGPRDSKGRSLRDISLRGRLMRYPCSYMIYSDAFDALSAVAKDAVYRHMWSVLVTRPAEDREAILGILRETKPGLPEYFKGAK